MHDSAVQWERPPLRPTTPGRASRKTLNEDSRRAPAIAGGSGYSRGAAQHEHAALCPRPHGELLDQIRHRFGRRRPRSLRRDPGARGGDVERLSPAEKNGTASPAGPLRSSENLPSHRSRANRWLDAREATCERGLEGGSEPIPPVLRNSVDRSLRSPRDDASSSRCDRSKMPRHVRAVLEMARPDARRGRTPSRLCRPGRDLSADLEQYVLVAERAAAAPRIAYALIEAEKGGSTAPTTAARPGRWPRATGGCGSGPGTTRP